MIGLCTAEDARRSEFYQLRDTLQKPVGTMNTHIIGQSIANNRNIVVKQALENGCSHVFFLDDDVIPEPDTLIKLICHNKDSIAALQLRRNHPHQPLVYSKFVDDKLLSEQYFLKEKQAGLIRIASSGLGCCLLKCKVFSKLEEPFFRLGEGNPEQINEDVGFFKRMQDIGLEHWCDLDAPVGHISSVIVRPVYSNDKWYTTYDSGNYERVAIPAVQKAEVEPENVLVGAS